MNAQAYFDQLIGVSEQLVAVLNEESQSIRARKITNLSNIQNEKTRLSSLYEQHIQRLGENPDLIDQAAEQQRLRLKELAHDFEDAARENIKTLKAAYDTGTRVLDAIKAAIEEETKQATSYTHGGRKPSKKKDAVSISLDETL